jgi:hypothetical protein
MTDYVKTEWVDEVLEDAERYDIKEDGGGAFKADMQIVLATEVTSAGTPINAANLNNLEDGVFNAQEQLTAAQEVLDAVVLEATRLIADAGGGLTISAGAVTITPESGHGYHTIETEAGAAADDLVTISGGATGDIVCLIAVNAAHVVTLKHGSGNLSLPYGLDLNLSAAHILLLRYSGSVWRAVSPSVPGAFVLTAGMWTSITDGCWPATKEEMATNKQTLNPLWFFNGGKTHAECSFPLPSDYDGGPLTAKFYWVADSTSTNSVVWGIQGRSYGDDEAVDQAFGTAVEVTDANGSTAFKARISATSAPLTLAGTPAAGELVHFRVYRLGTDADNLAVPAGLIAVKLAYTRL